MTGAERALILPHPPGKKALGRPRVVPLRGVIDARDFPKRSTVQSNFYAGRPKGYGKGQFPLVQQARERDSRKASVGRGVSRLRPRKAAVREGMTPAEEQRAQAPHHYRYQRSSGWRTGAPSRHPGSRRRWLRSATSYHGGAKSPAFARAGFCRWCLGAGNKLETALAGRGSGRWSSDSNRPKVFKYCPGDGSSSGPSPGLAAIAG